MAHGYYLNLEIALSKIIDREIAVMTDSNTLDEHGLEMAMNDSAFQHNLEHGIVAMIMMCDYLECCINSILRVVYRVPFCAKPLIPGYSVWELDESEMKQLLRESIRKKITRMIEDGKLPKSLKAESAGLWDKVMRTISFRNELMHYKSNYMQSSTIPTPEMWVFDGALSSFGKAKMHVANGESLGYRLTAPMIKDSWCEIQLLVSLIVERSGCLIKPNTQLIEADARDGFASFVVRKDEFLKIYPDGVRG